MSTKTTLANTLPIYDRAISHYPHLATIKDAKAFCQQLCYLAAIPTITVQEYWRIAEVAQGGGWKHKTPAARYQAAHIKQIKFCLNDRTDQDIIKHLETVDNVQGYIKSLIRDKIKQD